MPANNLYDIKKRITAAKQTHKITRTMELIASSRLQRSKTRLTRYKDWSKHMHEAAQCLPDSYYKPLPNSNKNNEAYVVFGGSKGLSGSYGPNLLNYAEPITSGGIVLAVGSATAAFFPKSHSFFGDDFPSAGFARTIVQSAKSIYESKEVSAVSLIYMRGTKLLTKQLFPLIRGDENDDSIMIVEPSPRVLFPALYDEYAESIVYEAHLHAFIAEQIARVSAMDSASKNADEIIENLQAKYNRIRQSSITQEIITVSNAVRGD